jgi:hypothetical protein
MEKAGRRYGGDGGQDAQRSAVASWRRCCEFFYKTTVAGGEWIEIDRRAFSASRADIRGQDVRQSAVAGSWRYGEFFLENYGGYR